MKTYRIKEDRGYWVEKRILWFYWSWQHCFETKADAIKWIELQYFPNIIRVEPPSKANKEADQLINHLNLEKE